MPPAVKVRGNLLTERKVQWQRSMLATQPTFWRQQVQTITWLLKRLFQRFEDNLNSLLRLGYFLSFSIRYLIRWSRNERKSCFPVAQTSWSSSRDKNKSNVSRLNHFLFGLLQRNMYNVRMKQWKKWRRMCGIKRWVLLENYRKAKMKINSID